MKLLKSVLKVMTAGCYILIFITIVLLSPILVGKRPMIVLSGSMEPTFQQGSLIYMEKAEFDEIKAGDIVSYGREEIVSHRVIGKMNQTKSLLTRGDANETIDPEVPAKGIVGRIWEGVYIPYAGFLFYGLRKPQIIMVLVMILILDMLISFPESCKKMEIGNKNHEKSTASIL